MNPERADIIIPGAAILDMFMKELSLDSITITSGDYKTACWSTISREWMHSPF